jgi:putative DNA primase/helicase
VRSRAGWWQDDLAGRTYLFPPAALREAASGYDARRILDALDGAGWIVDRDTGKRSKKVKVPGTGRTERLYAIRPAEEAGE